MELHIRDVAKTCPNGVQALKDVTLTIPAGMYGLRGRNGAGKSTLMRILATLQDPDDGSETIRITVPKEAGRAGIVPSRKLIHRDREDNVVEVKAAEAGDTL